MVYMTKEELIIFSLNEWVKILSYPKTKSLSGRLSFLKWYSTYGKILLPFLMIEFIQILHLLSLRQTFIFLRNLHHETIYCDNCMQGQNLVSIFSKWWGIQMRLYINLTLCVCTVQQWALDRRKLQKSLWGENIRLLLLFSC